MLFDLRENLKKYHGCVSVSILPIYIVPKVDVTKYVRAVLEEFLLFLLTLTWKLSHLAKCQKKDIMVEA